MDNIDHVMDLLDWNNSLEDQSKGLALARKVKNLVVFLQPCDEKHSKNVWENCAIVLSEKSDIELSPYLIELLEWLQDLNWPGVLRILNRLCKYADRPSYDLAFDNCIKRAQDLNDNIWISNLSMIDRKI